MFYSCKEITHDDGSVTYEILDPQGNTIAVETSFARVEVLLAHLNSKVMRGGTLLN